MLKQFWDVLKGMESDYENAAREFSYSKTNKTLGSLRREVGHFYPLAPTKCGILIESIQKGLDSIEMDESGRIKNSEMNKLPRIESNIGTLIGEIFNTQVFNYVQNIEGQLEEFQKMLKEAEGLSGLPKFMEWDLLLGVYETGWGIFVQELKYSVFLPMLESLGKRIRAFGNPNNIGSDILSIYEAAKTAEMSSDLNLKQLIRDKPRVFPAIADQLKEKLEAAMNYYKSMIRSNTLKAR